LEDTQAVAALVDRCLGGDTAAWEEIVRLYHRRIYNVCFRFAGAQEDAEDLTQEVFIKMYRTLKSYDTSKGAFITWVTTIARNLLVDHFRRSKYDRVTGSLESAPSGDLNALTVGEQLPDVGPSPDAGIQTQEIQKVVHQALQKLSPELREAVILRDLQDMEYREIAQVLRVPEGTVKSRINRGRAELARHLSRTYRQVS
jgi:RNA polymerase sigma-70 factor (ECF subfamily)